MFCFEVARIRCAPVTFESSTNIYSFHQNHRDRTPTGIDLTEHSLDDLGDARVDAQLAPSNRQDTLAPADRTNRKASIQYRRQSLNSRQHREAAEYRSCNGTMFLVRQPVQGLLVHAISA